MTMAINFSPWNTFAQKIYTENAIVALESLLQKIVNLFAKKLLTCGCKMYMQQHECTSFKFKNVSAHTKACMEHMFCLIVTI